MAQNQTTAYVFYLFFMATLIHFSIQAKSSPLHQPRVLSVSLSPHAAIEKSQRPARFSFSYLADRVNSIDSKLHHALSIQPSRPGVSSNRSNLIYDADPQVPVIYGDFRYFARMGVGQPTKEFYLVLDTVSDLSWLQCLPCKLCFEQFGPIFDPTKSISYHPLPCDSKKCTSLRAKGTTHYCRENGNCDYSVTYGEFSSTLGELATETLTFGDSHSVDNVVIGCGHLNNGSFHAAIDKINSSVESKQCPDHRPSSADRDSATDEIKLAPPASFAPAAVRQQLCPPRSASALPLPRHPPSSLRHFRYRHRPFALADPP